MAVAGWARVGDRLRGWTRFERIWLLTATGVISAISLVLGDNWLGFVSALSGIFCVVLAAKGKIATYYVGIVQTGTYAYIAYGLALYGEAMLNAFFFLPAQFVGWWLWTRNRNRGATGGEDVRGRRLSWRQWSLLVPAIVLASSGYALFLDRIGAAQVGLDSYAVVISLFAQLLMVLRYAEQWILWIVVNLLTISLWAATIAQTGSTDYAVLVMWIAFLVNSIYGFLNWRRIAARATGSDDADDADDGRDGAVPVPSAASGW